MTPRLSEIVLPDFGAIRRHPKFSKAGPGPSWLWLCAFNETKNTGFFVSDTIIDHIGVRYARRMSEHLVSAGLWERLEGGWQILELDAVVVRQPKPPEQPAPKPSNGVLVFPTTGLHRSWTLTAEQVTAWKAAYTTIDVLAECKKALVWVHANAPKTAKGMPAFLVSWLNRASDRRPTVDSRRDLDRVHGRTGAAPPGKYEHH